MKNTVLFLVTLVLGCSSGTSGEGEKQDSSLFGSGGQVGSSTGGSQGNSSGGKAGSAAGGTAGHEIGGVTGSGSGGASSPQTGSGGNKGTGGSTHQGTGGMMGTGGSSATGAGGAKTDAGLDGTTGPDSGAHETGADLDSSGDTVAQVSYTNEIAPLLSENCTSCHGSSNPPKGISLNNYTNVKANATAANKQIQNGNMPPSGSLSTANKRLFQNWVDQGTQNN
jgi:hypothetical protein